MAHAAAHPEEEAEYRAALLARCGAPAGFVERIESGNRAARAAAPPVAIAATLDGDGGEVPGAPGWRFAWTPGHTAGHVIFHHAPSQFAQVGDVLFQGSVGRTDLPQGDHKQLIESIVTKLWPLGDATAFIPGHGKPSTFAHERAHNMFVSDRALSA